MKKKNVWNRICATVLAGVLAFPVFGMTAQADEVKYQGADSYVLNYGGQYEGIKIYQYLSHYKPQGTNGVSGSQGARTGIVFNLYNTKSGETLPAYCMDCWIGAEKGSNYRRLNLEDATYLAGDAGLMRSVVLNSFPAKSLEELGAAAKVEGLSMNEAIMATQLAVWKTAHGGKFEVTDFWNNGSRPTVDLTNNKANILYYDELMKDLKNSFPNHLNEKGYPIQSIPEVEHTVESRMEAVYNYLMNLEPTEPSTENKVVSNDAFIDWSTPKVEKNADGSYNVTVGVKVDVQMAEKDSLTLSAFMGDGTYFKSAPLKDGINEVELTIQNVPVGIAYDKVRIAIDGEQTVSRDVFLFDAENNRQASQTMVGIYAGQMPVHAEIVAEPERVLNIYKTTKIPVGKNGDGTIAYNRFPLENITFDLYHVATLDAYLSGQYIPEQDIDIAKIKNAHPYPDYVLTTNEEGKASVSLTKNELPDGVYVVAERENPAINKNDEKHPIKPFYVMLPTTNDTGDGWTYEITAEPKNGVIDGPEIRKDVIEIEHEDKSGNDEQRASVDAGVPFTWIVRGDVPADIADAKSYVITDTLDYRLTYAENLVVKVDEITANADNSVSSGDVLVKDKDYTLKVTDEYIDVSDGDAKEGTKKIEVALTDVGMDLVAKLVGDNEEDYEIRVYFDTIIDEDVAGFMGENIDNKATLDYTNSVNFDFGKESDNPRVYTCGINLKKYDAKDNAKTLAGATFMVARKATAEEIADVNIETSTLVIGRGETAEVVYVDFYNNKALAGDKVNTVVTDDNGAATIYGLAEIFEADPEDEEKDGDGIKTADYYLVETKAPEGYNLLSFPIKVKLNEVSHTDANILGVANSNRFELPSTGGIGTSLFTLVGAALTLGSGAVLAGKKRKEEE